MNVGHRADPDFLAVSPQLTLVINPVVGCHYFPQGPWLLSQPKRSPLGRYQIILLGDRGTQVLVACPKPLQNGAQPGLQPATCESQVHCPANSATYTSHCVLSRQCGFHACRGVNCLLVIHHAVHVFVGLVWALGL